jgi:hypothetical protein
MPLQATSGAASYDAFGGGVAAVPQYIEEVFNTWAYQGNNDPVTIVNGIDLAGKGGLVWTKRRNGTSEHHLFDTNRGGTSDLNTNSNIAAQNAAGYPMTFNSNGFSESIAWGSTQSVVSWTFRKQPKFFDVVTWTGNGANRTIAHNLGSVPGCIIVKRTNASADWQVYHRSLANTEYMVLNSTAAKATGATRWNSTTPTSTVFSLGTDATVNASGGTYVAYVYAHDAGGFGLTGTDNVISCGSFISGSTANINLGWEPQWLLVKSTSSGTTGPWQIFDNMRGVLGSNDSGSKSLSANASDAEVSFSSGTNNIFITATGFSVVSPSYSGIYIAIRRPMKVPTTGTSVFSPNIGATDTTPVTTGFPVDLLMHHSRNESSVNTAVLDRLRGTMGLISSSNGAESDYGTPSRFQSNTSVLPDIFGNDFVSYSFRRAPGFFDEVCYSGAFSNRQQAHNLGAVPEMMIVKARTGATAQSWDVYHAALGASAYLRLDQTDAVASSTWPFNGTTPTSSLFYVGIPGGGNYAGTNAAGYTYVAYLFATCPGVSKVGSYTGNGTTQAIACGFTGGARFVLIKRTDATGDWYVYDTARGMTVLTDPYLRLNTNAGETATLGSVITSTGGFTVNAAILAAINTNAASYIFLAIA